MCLLRMAYKSGNTSGKTDRCYPDRSVWKPSERGSAVSSAVFLCVDLFADSADRCGGDPPERTVVSWHCDDRFFSALQLLLPVYQYDRSGGVFPCTFLLYGEGETHCTPVF